jgi:ABC-type multidrug transport system fused ATPase/permease subunit
LGYSILLANFSLLFSVHFVVTGSARCAEKMFVGMAHRVLRAPLSYFETTPLGRILNRFTYDVEVLDVELSVSMMGLLVSFSWLISAVVVMVVVLPWMIVGITPVAIIYFFIQYYYRMSGPDLQRIDAVSRSPLQASLAEGKCRCDSMAERYTSMCTKGYSRSPLN